MSNSATKKKSVVRQRATPRSRAVASAFAGSKNQEADGVVSPGDTAESLLDLKASTVKEAVDLLISSAMAEQAVPAEQQKKVQAIMRENLLQDEELMAEIKSLFQVS